jgi:putative tryptophan/tyrosine transport system substrate-binding protein
MRRRSVLVGLGGFACVRPSPVGAQQASVPVIGFLNSTSLDGYSARIAAFRQGIAAAGFVDGKTVTVEFRHANGQYDLLPEMAAELVRLRVAVIVATGSNAALAAKSATASIPIVFSTSGNPVQVGLVPSLARPGGNITGTARLNSEVIAKRLQLLREVVPAASAIALLVNPANPAVSDPLAKDAEQAARTQGIGLHLLRASTEREIDEAFATAAQLRVGAVVIGIDAFFNSRTTQMAAAGLRHRLPTIGQEREFVTAGCLMSYGGNLDDGYRIVGSYVARILKGEKPADLPIQQSTKLEFLINLKTAKALDLTIPPDLLARVDEVIE